MPIVDVKVWKGISKDAVEHIISGITKVFVELGIPERAVEVIVQEVPKTHWGIGGTPASRVMPDEKPP
ncbi:MAG: 4-oxalocrotonate tautomerase family protein [Candidatus Thorarchaeota archaeon]